MSWGDAMDPEFHWPLFAGIVYCFWCGDGAAPEVDGVFRNRNALGEVQRLPGQHHGCKANESSFCMEFMRPR